MFRQKFGAPALIILGVCLQALAVQGVRVDGQVDGKVNRTWLTVEDRILASVGQPYTCVTLDWWPPSKCDYGRCAWGMTSILNINLNHPLLIAATQALKADGDFYLRLGGSLQDFVLYNMDAPSCNTNFSDPTNATVLGYDLMSGCLSGGRWSELTSFCSGLPGDSCKIIFGVNGLYGRALENPCDASVNCRFEKKPCCYNWTGQWVPDNARTLLQRIAKDTSAGLYKLAALEFGNEITTRGVEARLDAATYGKDVRMFYDEIQRAFDEAGVDPSLRPMVLASDGDYYDEDWYTQFLQIAGDLIDGLTYHKYPLGAGVDPTVGDNALNWEHLNRFGDLGQRMHDVVTRNAPRNIKPWMGETGGAYNSGRFNVTDTFWSGFWFLDALGTMASTGHGAFCRQALMGGNYELIDRVTYRPNPDFYSLLLWKRTMGHRVLHVSQPMGIDGEATRQLRVYAMCSRVTNASTTQTEVTAVRAGSVTLLLINLSNDTTIEVNPTIAGFTLNYTSARLEYILTAVDNDLTSHFSLLNGSPLLLSEAGEYPTMEPRVVPSGGQPIQMPPLSYGFVILQEAGLTQCS